MSMPLPGVYCGFYSVRMGSDRRSHSLGSCEFISSTEGARKCLEDISFPASKQDILSRIENSSGPEVVIVAANQIPEKVYESLNELLDYLGAKEPFMQFEIPEPLTLEHEELHVVLKAALEIGGDVGAAAKRVADLLHPHFVKEEEFAMPPLGLLRTLSEGKVTQDMADVLPLVDRLKADLPEMLKEHGEIVNAVKSLGDTAAKAGLDEYVRFAEKLRVHAQTEEEVLYPASILVGEYVRMRLGVESESQRE